MTRLAVVLDQHHLALDDPDELVLGRVPVALAGPLAGRQAQQVDPELVEADRVAQLPAAAVLAGRVVGGGIAVPMRVGAVSMSILGMAVGLRLVRWKPKGRTMTEVAPVSVRSTLSNLPAT
jgi:hypothetical protein